MPAVESVLTAEVSAEALTTLFTAVVEASRGCCTVASKAAMVLGNHVQVREWLSWGPGTEKQQQWDPGQTGRLQHSSNAGKVAAGYHT